MLEIFSVTGPIFLAIAAGYVSTRTGLFSQDDMRVMGRFVINLALPCLLFNAVAPQRIGDILNGSYLLGYAGGSLATLALGYAWARRVTKQDPRAATYMAMGMCCSNSGYVGFPILLLALPSVAGGALALNMVVENFIMIPLLLALAERGHGPASHWHEVVGQSLRRLAVNPLVIGLVIGLVFSLFEWRLPAPAARTVTLFAQASSALSLFVIGGSLVGLQLRGLRSAVAQIGVGKLVLHPLCLLAVMTWLVPIGDPQLKVALLLTGAMPMMGSAETKLPIGSRPRFRNGDMSTRIAMMNPAAQPIA